MDFLLTLAPTALTIEQGIKTLICISFTKLNIHLLLERVFLNLSGYSLTVTQIQANATKRLYKFRNRSHFSRDAKRIYEKTCYSHASSVVSTVTPIFRHITNCYVVIIDFSECCLHMVLLPIDMIIVGKDKDVLTF
ncbi:hypothetical protein CSKR_113503 [Clonorchis sinensis]|uniref:Uncharacterized protein n=1 Tax=Clonorchis sinensis TaxID=79923 RepID=A0A419PGL6_CLOSI|nr:hypothetical protein CSKR_113503 [Clonorchis sinensis]